jgi:hypothetical protein
MRDHTSTLKQFQSRLLLAALKQRLLSWVMMLAPWFLMPFNMALIGATVVLLVIIVEAVWMCKKVVTQLVKWLNAEFPNLEDSGALLDELQISTMSTIAQLQQQRLLTRIHTILDEKTIRDLAKKYCAIHLLWVLLSFLCAGLLYASSMFTKKTIVAPIIQKTTIQSIDRSLTLKMRVTPPMYTGVAAFDSPAKELQVPENSEVQWCVVSVNELDKKAEQANITKNKIQLSNGQVLDFKQTCVKWTATESLFWTWSGDKNNSRTTLKVLADQAPVISVLQPKEFVQILSSDAKWATMEVNISDDYKIVLASLHLTLARGSGENIRFSDREIPIPQSKDPKVRHWEKRWSLQELGMEHGDELYFFVRAIDNAEVKPHVITSPTYTLRLPAIVEEEEDTSVLPILAKPESLRSQRQIIIDTEQLVADMKGGKLPSAVIQERSQVIASDQGVLRRRYGRFLGEESSLFVDDEHDDHDGHEGHNEGKEKSVNTGVDLAAQYGHAHDQAENATLFDEKTKIILRRALVAMWDAEKQLRALNPRLALAPENRALEAIKELQQADRIYLHKAAFLPPVIKEEKRLTGDVLNPKNKSRTQTDAEKAVPEAMQILIKQLNNNGTLPALWTVTARDWIAATLQDDEQKLAAQGALQDVNEGCKDCRTQLAAWLRLGIVGAHVKLQAKSQMQNTQKSPFDKMWNQKQLNSKSSNKEKP